MAKVDGTHIKISIHALREEGDPQSRLRRPPVLLFLSTPSARRATVAKGTAMALVEFLSTPSARRATRGLSVYSRACRYFYPRPPRGGRQPT